MLLKYQVIVLTIIINYSDSAGWAHYHIRVSAVESHSELLLVLHSIVILDWDSHTGLVDTLTECQFYRHSLIVLLVWVDQNNCYWYLASEMLFALGLTYGRAVNSE